MPLLTPRRLLADLLQCVRIVEILRFNGNCCFEASIWGFGFRAETLADKAARDQRIFAGSVHSFRVFCCAIQLHAQCTSDTKSKIKSSLVAVQVQD